MTDFIAPYPSLGKAKKSKKSKKQLKHAKNLKKGKASRNGKTIKQVVLMCCSAHQNTRGITAKRIKKTLLASDIAVSDFVLKKVLRKLILQKILTHKGTSKARFISTGKRLTGIKKRSRATRKSQKQDAEFRAKLRKVARLANRGGRTYAQCVYDFIYIQRKSTKSDKKKLTRFSQIRAYLRKNNMAISQFILHKVIDRMVAKKSIRLSKHRYVLTSSKKMRASKNLKK